MNISNMLLVLNLITAVILTILTVLGIARKTYAMVFGIAATFIFWAFAYFMVLTLSWM